MGIDWTELSSNINRIWNKDLSATIAVDLPRLVQNMTLTDLRHPVTHTKLHRRMESMDEHLTKPNQEEKIQCVLLTLARALEDKDHLDGIQNRFFDYVRPNAGQERADIARDIQQFITEVLGDSPITRTLKACNQGIIAPAVLQLKKNICPQLMFKDGGGWCIKITLSNEDILVQHRKREKQLRTDGKKEDFEFEWLLEMHFTHSMDVLKAVDFKVTELLFSEEVTQDMAERTRSCFQDYFVQQPR